MLSGLISTFIYILVQDDKDLIILHDALGFIQCHLTIGMRVLSWTCHSRLKQWLFMFELLLLSSCTVFEKCLGIKDMKERES
jgi:hypothetical protein